MKITKRILLSLFFGMILIPISAFADMTVRFLNVGQGDAALIQADGKNMLIDTGPFENSGALLSFILDAGIRRIDVLVMTHPHEDHIGGVNDVLLVDVGEIWMPKVQGHISAPDPAPIPGTTTYLGPAMITVLGPLKQSYDELNNFSLILRIDYGENSFLFMGDAEALSEEELLQSGANINADVLKVGNHASSTSTSQAFLDAVDPEWAVISCGNENAYGYPHEEVIDRLLSAGVSIVRTDTDGTIIFTSDGRTLRRIDESMVGLIRLPEVNVYESPSMFSAVVAKLDYGAFVDIMEDHLVYGETWYQVEVEGKTGFLNEGYLHIMSSEEAGKYSAPPTPTPLPTPVGTKYIGNMGKNGCIYPIFQGFLEIFQHIFPGEQFPSRNGYFRIQAMKRSGHCIMLKSGDHHLVARFYQCPDSNI